MTTELVDCELRTQRLTRMLGFPQLPVNPFYQVGAISVEIFIELLEFEYESVLCLFPSLPRGFQLNEIVPCRVSIL